MSKAIRTILAALLAAIIAFPFLYGFSASFFSVVDFTDSQVRFLPSAISLRNYALALSHRHFPRYVLNSTITSVMLSLLRLAVSIPAAFALTHLRFRGQRLIAGIIMATLFIPSDVLLYENYSTIASMGLLDSYMGIMLPSIFSGASVLMLYGAFLAGDRDVYDAARIDGAGDLRYMWQILTPLYSPFAVAILIQSFISSFNSYLWPLIVTNRDRMRTVQIGLTMLGFAEEGEKGAQFAAAMIVTIPFLALLAAGRNMIMKALVDTKED